MPSWVLRQLVSEPRTKPRNALAECQMLQEQAFMGKYDMPALLFGRLATSFRRCADYVGPISVAYLGEGAGRASSPPRLSRLVNSLRLQSSRGGAPRDGRGDDARAGSDGRRVVTHRTSRSRALPPIPRGKSGRPDMMAFVVTSLGDQDLPELPSQGGVCAPRGERGEDVRDSFGQLGRCVPSSEFHHPQLRLRACKLRRAYDVHQRRAPARARRFASSIST